MKPIETPFNILPIQNGLKQGDVLSPLLFNSAPITEPYGSLPCSQEPATRSYPGLDASGPHFPTLLP